MYVVKQYSPYLGRWHFQVGILYNHIIATKKLLTLFSRSVGVGGGGGGGVSVPVTYLFRRDNASKYCLFKPKNFTRPKRSM